jgi:hypothetical protein
MTNKGFRYYINTASGIDAKGWKKRILFIQMEKRMLRVLSCF